jgi:hypothetical protein
MLAPSIMHHDRKRIQMTTTTIFDRVVAIGSHLQKAVIWHCQQKPFTRPGTAEQPSNSNLNFKPSQIMKNRTCLRQVFVPAILLTLLFLRGLEKFYYSSRYNDYDSLSSSSTITRENRTEVVDVPPLQIAWLMSFPNSGTTYTNHLIQDYTKTTTATNYGQEQSTTETSIPVLPDASLVGPFFRYPTWNKPPKYILTKTHCGAELPEAPNTVEEFEQDCRSGKRIWNGTKIKTTYNDATVKRAVHLIRNPFDNIVARLHMKQHNWKSGDPSHRDRLKVFNKTREGFRAYCINEDSKSALQDWNNPTMIFGADVAKEHNSSGLQVLVQHAKNTPCHAEFILYTRWHNFALKVLQRNHIPALTLFYEDYASDWEETAQRLFDFLALEPAKDGVATEFLAGKHYEDHYAPAEREAAKQLMFGLATKDFQKLLQRYFP